MMFANTVRWLSAGTLGLAALLALPLNAEAGRVKIASATASSTLTDDNGTSYPASNVKDGKSATAWFEGEKGAGLGAKVTLKLAESTDVQKVKIWAGYWFSASDWQQNFRPGAIKITAGDKTVEATLDDKKEAVEVQIGGAKTDTIVVEVTKAHSAGAAWDATGISEIQVFDARPGKGAVAKSYSASSSAAADADGNYEGANTQDGLKDTMWCEGAKDEGVGSTLTFDFGSKTTISGIHLLNGVASSNDVFKKYNRVEEATLAFDDGSTETVSFKALMPFPEKKAFSPKSTSKVVLTVTKVKRGTDAASNDTCMSEVEFAN